MGQRPRKGLDTSSGPARVWLCCLVASGWVLFWKTCEKVGVKGWSQDTGTVVALCSWSHCLFPRSWAVWTLTTWTAPRSLWRSWTVTPSHKSRRRSSMPSSRTCPVPTGPKLLIWTWVCECTMGSERPMACGRGDTVGLNPSALLWQVPPLQVLGKGKVSGMLRRQKRLSKLMQTLLACESSMAPALGT